MSRSSEILVRQQEKLLTDLYGGTFASYSFLFDKTGILKKLEPMRDDLKLQTLRAIVARLRVVAPTLQVLKDYQAELSKYTGYQRTGHGVYVVSDTAVDKVVKNDMVALKLLQNDTKRLLAITKTKDLKSIPIPASQFTTPPPPVVKPSNASAPLADAAPPAPLADAPAPSPAPLADASPAPLADAAPDAPTPASAFKKTRKKK